MNSLSKRQVNLLLGVVLLTVAGWLLYQHNAEQKAQMQQAIVLSQQQSQDKNVLQNKLDLSNQNAEMFANFITKAQAGLQPITHFTVQAPSVQVTAEDVAKRINQNDSTLPRAALENTDNTVVSTRPLSEKEKEAAKKANEANKGAGKPQVNEEYGVNVYKNNNYRNWEWSAGYGQHGEDRYIPVELQRNFSKDAAVSYEHHLGGHEKGWEVKYTRKTDKLLFLF